MPNFCRSFLTFLLLGLLCLSPTASAWAQDAEAEKKCINADRISSYRVISDELVRLEMQGLPDVLLRLKRHCPQLYYHKYMSFTPVNGQLCARFDDIVTRSGTPCRIESFSSVPEEGPDAGQ